ncbi:MAG TPA: EVE domain-containing protein [Polyangiaceae bacterium]|nr:EVE domain-containing protein [Polyangiaceae bacterium]
MARGYWLIKSEPDAYPYAQLVKDGKTVWDGVRNFQARNNLRAMKEGDLVFFYHSNVGKEIVGVARVVREAYPDPRAKGEDWSAVDVGPSFALAKPVSLETIKKEPKLEGLQLITHSRLSVVPLSAAHFEHILALGETKNP